jgi:alpha-L-rhamnosidase
MFTFQGYRYARITLNGGADARRYRIRSDQLGHRAVTASFTSGKPAGRPARAEHRSGAQRSNFIEVPTDCPQRDERLGWTGDAQVFAGTACYLADSARFLDQVWVRDVMADQREDGAIPHVVPDPTLKQPAALSRLFRLDRLGRRHRHRAVAALPSLWRSRHTRRSACRPWSSGSISSGRSRDGPVVSPPRQWGGRGFSFGDWLQPKGPSGQAAPDHRRRCGGDHLPPHHRRARGAHRWPSRQHRSAGAPVEAIAAEAVREAFARRVRHRRRAASPMTTRPPMRSPSSTT